MLGPIILFSGGLFMRLTRETSEHGLHMIVDKTEERKTSFFRSRALVIWDSGVRFGLPSPRDKPIGMPHQFTGDKKKNDA